MITKENNSTKTLFKMLAISRGLGFRSLPLTIMSILISIALLVAVVTISSVTASPNRTRVYVTNNSGFFDTVSVIDISSNMVEATIPVGLLPLDVAITPDGTSIYVLTATTISVIETNSYSEEATIPATGRTLEVNHAGTRIYVATDNGILVIDTASNTVVDTVPLGVGATPAYLAISLDDTRLYATENSSSSALLWVVDTGSNTILGTVDPGFANNNGSGVAVSPDGSRVYMINNGPAIISVINTLNSSVIQNIPVGDLPSNLALSPNGSRLYVTNSNSNTLSVINTVSNTVVDTLPMVAGPSDVVVDRTGNFVYVTNHNANTLTVIQVTVNKNNVIAIIGLQGGPTGLAVTP